MRTTTLSSLSSKFLAALAIIAMVLVALPAMPAHAASITVTSTADELTPGNGCSLREAILNANSDSATYPDCAAGTGADTIVLASGSTYTLSLVATDSTGGDLDISDPDGLTIQASDTTNAVIDANDIDRVIDVTAGSGSLTLIGITVTNGNAASGGRGGGINHLTDSTLTLTNSTVSSNVATNPAACGGGIYSSSNATINITNSTIDGNTCTELGGDGGGLWKGTGGALNISNSTFSNNSVLDNGGGFRIIAGTATIKNSTFENNSSGDLGGAIEVEGATVTIDFSTFSGNGSADAGDNGGGDIHVSGGSAAITASILANAVAGQNCSQSLTGTASLTNTLVESNVNCSESSVIIQDPALGPLASNGGPTKTMAITQASPAYNAAASCGSTSADQRGIARPQFGLCDLGAYEFQDTSIPTVLSIVRANASPTNAASVDYTVTFSESVTGVDTGDFSLTTTGVSGASVSGVSGSGTSWTVTVNTGSGSGTIRLNLVDDDSIKDISNNPLGGTGAGNGSFMTGEVYTVDKTAPVVSSITRADANPTNAASVHFTVTFSETVTGVDAGDFSLTTTGVSGAAVSGVSGTGISRTVTVNTGTGTGTIRLNLIDDDSIVDAMGYKLGGTGAGNGSFTTGETYLIQVQNADTTGVFRPSNGALYLKNSNTTGFADVQINYGLGGDYPVTGDWDGNGTDTIGIYRNGSFYLRNSNTIGFADLVFAFGAPGDQPIAGDWDGDGTDTIGVYRSSTGEFFLRNSNTAGPPEMTFALGVPGDVGIAGDWNGNGVDTTGVFRPSNGALYLKNTNATGFADIQINYGLPGDMPVTGDWNGDGIDTIGIYRNGAFYLRNSNTIGFADLVFALGVPGDMPISGDWDGLP